MLFSTAGAWKSTTKCLDFYCKSKEQSTAWTSYASKVRQLDNIKRFLEKLGILVLSMGSLTLLFCGLLVMLSLCVESQGGSPRLYALSHAHVRLLRFTSGATSTNLLEPAWQAIPFFTCNQRLKGGFHSILCGCQASLVPDNRLGLAYNK